MRRSDSRPMTFQGQTMAHIQQPTVIGVVGHDVGDRAWQFFLLLAIAVVRGR